MSYDIFKPVGATKASQPTAGGTNVRMAPVFGVVKNNIDPIRAGRIQVYISDFGVTDPDSSDSWVTVSYMSTFFGSVRPSSPETGYGSYVANPASYGAWNSPPDIGTVVVCIFINGDPAYGFYIGCVPQPEALHMVPAIGSSKKVIFNNSKEATGYGGAAQLPVTNMNTNNEAIADENNFLNESKPVHSYSAAIMSQQGIIRDPIRGTISSSAQRESPSRVGWGISTPGRPIYQGGYTDETIAQAATENKSKEGMKVVSRRGGHSIVMDDGDIIGQDQLVRIRSAGGHQILMSDDGQTLFVLHSNGQSWIELGKEGTIDMFATNSVNIRTQGDLNFHADRNINFEAKKKFSLHAEDLVSQTDKTTAIKVGTNQSVQTGGTFTHKVSGPMSLESGGESSFKSASTTFINGSIINLNTGESSTVPQEVPAIPIIAHPDTLFDENVGWAAAPGKLQSITSRAPAHAPWANANKGTDAKASGSAGSELPSAPTAEVASTNLAASKTPVANPVTSAGVSTVPPAIAVSASLDKTATSALVGAAAQNASKVPAATLGAAITQTTAGPVVNVGVFAQTPQQLEQAGIIKPGSAALVQSLISGGASINSAMADNLFTGKPGAENLASYMQNTGAQVQAQISLYQQSQTALTNAGILSGKEAPESVAGVIMAGADVGVANTIATIRAVSGTRSTSSYGSTGVASRVTNAINSGQYAAGLSQTSMGGLSTIASAVASLGSLSKATSVVGVTGAAFGAIVSGFKPFQTGIPQNLGSIARENAEARADESRVRNATLSGDPGQRTSSVIAGVQGVIGDVSAIKNARSSEELLGAAVHLAKNIGRVVTLGDNVPGVDIRTRYSSAASGISNLPGGDSLSAIAGAALGLDAVTSLISDSVSAQINNISIQAVTGSGVPPAIITSMLTEDAGLLSMAEDYLSGDAWSTLNSAISSTSSVGGATISLPTIGDDTYDRSELTAQIDSLLGDSRIPRPNFETGPSAGAKAQVKSIQANLNRLINLENERDNLIAVAAQAEQAFDTAQQTLPQGSPEITSLFNDWKRALAEVQAKSDAIDNETSA